MVIRKKKIHKKSKGKKMKKNKGQTRIKMQVASCFIIRSGCGMNQSRCGLSFLNVESLISLISLHLSHVPQETGDLHTSRHQWAAATGPHSPPRPSRTSDRCQIMIYNDDNDIYHDINMS